VLGSGTCAVFAATLTTVALAAGNPATPDKPANPSGQPIDPDDVNAVPPASFGDEMRTLVPVTAAELGAADSSFRKWVELIHTGHATKQTMRLYSFFKTRLDPFDKLVPVGWRDRGTAVMRNQAETNAALQQWGITHKSPPDVTNRSAPPAASPAVTAGISPYGRWIPIGPYTIPGRTLGADRPDGQPNTLYIAVADGGVWRTRDGAATWEPLTDREATLSGGAVLLDPTNPKTIWFGTGEGNGAIDNYGGIGVLKSVDDGLTWTRSNNFSGSVRRLAIHKSEPTRLYAAGDSGCYLSTDGGATFNLMSTVGLPTNAGASDVLIRPDDPNTVFCAIWGGANGGIYRSTDHAASFQLLTTGLPAMGTVQRISLAISKSNPAIMLAGIDQNNGTIYKTVDGGTTWAALAGGSVGFCGGQCWYDNALGIDAGDPNVMYAGGVGLSRSLDGGTTWAGSDAGVHVDHHFIFTPVAGEVFTTSDGGVFHSTSQAGSWTTWGLGLDTTQYYGNCRNPADPDWAAGGTQDNGSQRRYPANTWTTILGGDGGMCMTGPAGSNVMIGEYQSANLQRSADGGNSFSDANGGIGHSEPHPWVGILEADPTNRNNFWTGTSKIYRSLDARASNWVAVSMPLGLSVSALGVAPSNSDVVYAGFDPGPVFVSSNATAATGVSWTNIRPSYLPTRSVRRIRVNPNDANTAYFVFSGYGAGKIWKSTNRGSSYTDITGDLPDIPVNDLVIDIDNPGTLIAATDLGMFRSDSDGAHWYGWSAGYPTVASIELTYDRTNDRLRVGTHGRSMWEWREASANPVGVPDGGTIPGTPMRAEKLAGGATLRVRWDSLSCTARDYNLFYGDLDNVATHTYLGAVCGLGTSGIADVPMPSSASGNLFFVVASTDGNGNESPHDYLSPGVPSSANGVGYCGITQQVVSASCP
ncbi:MAG TPA: hypothetical protein VMR65_11260, partial [Candidatus Sulfotelmatobacter sp.]|nr:hypothetical protein [Candidatus Sulfotelmatobacter sp.]